ncbi:MAG: PadR family transcriptional regulator [Thermoanaerobaculia bacterium]|nr:PadR family transcriptional regulator [Thermoanaerobaculia bacterium]
MSVRHGLLAMLAEETVHGYALKSRFEERTAGAWPLNIGQVYTTLGRLERDGLIEADPGSEVEEAHRGHRWRITGVGQNELREWYRSPVGDDPVRDELTIKVLLAIADPGTDSSEVVHRQRQATMQRLQSLTLKKMEVGLDEVAEMLLLDSLILRADAEARWLNLCDERLRARGLP